MSPPWTAIRLAAIAGLVALLTLLAMLTGCGGAGRAADEGRPSVVAAFYPYQFLAERIGGGDVRVVNLTRPGAEPHNLELTPRQVADVGSATLLIYQRGFQPALDETVERSKPRRLVEVGELLGTAPVEDTGGAGTDPHAWLDPSRFAVVAAAVGDALAAADPARAPGYRARTEALTADLAALDQEFRSGLTRCRSRTIVTNHAAFGHLAARYRLTQIALSGLAPEAEPSPARLAEVSRTVRRHRVTTMFVEPLASPKAAQSLAGDLGVRTAVLDPVEGLTAAPGAHDYFSVMRANLAALRTALGCT